MIYKAGKYIRLSDKDRDKEESNSVDNQRDIINQFIDNNNDIISVNEYVYDGYTGANYERPRKWKN